MAYAQQSNDYKQPPPYVEHEQMRDGMPYQTQERPPPVQQGYYVSQPPPQPMFVVHPQPTVVIQPLGGFLGHNPQPMQCPTCRQQIVSTVRYEIGIMTLLIAFLIFIFGGILCCFLIPFCVPGCQDAVHTCPACHAPLGQRGPF